MRHVAAEGLASFLQVAHFLAVIRGLIKGGLGDILIGNGNAEPASELAQFLFVLISFADG